MEKNPSAAVLHSFGDTQSGTLSTYSYFYLLFKFDGALKALKMGPNWQSRKISKEKFLKAKK